MSFYSKQKWFCQICGTEQHSELANAPFHGRVCGKMCWNELKWRETLSTMGQEYEADPRQYDSNGDVVKKKDNVST